MCISITSNKISSCRPDPFCKRGGVKSKFYSFMIEGKSQIISSDTFIQIKMAQRESTYCDHIKLKKTPQPHVNLFHSQRKMKLHHSSFLGGGGSLYRVIITLGWHLNTSLSPLQSLKIKVALKAFVILAMIGLKRNI